MITLLKQTKFQLLIILLLTVLAYSNIFSNAFATDDVGYFYNWQIPKHLENIPKIFTTDSVPKDEQGVYRPGKALLIMLSYHLWGLNLVPYHGFSLFVQLASTILVYFITRELTSKVKKTGLHLRGGELLPFITALLFGLHPIHTEAVTFILASYDSAGLAFFLLSFWLYLKCKKVWWYLGSLVAAAAAFLTYEMTFTLPLVILLYHLCFRQKMKAGIVPYWLILGGVLILRVFLLHIPARGQYLDGNFYLTMLLMTKAFIRYVSLLIWPVNLSLDHQIAPGIYSVSYESYINLQTLRSLSFFNAGILLNILAIVLLLICGLKFRKNYPLVVFGIFWFIVTLLPVSNIIPQGSIFAERYAYLASFGFCLVFAWLLLKSMSVWRNIILITVIVTVMFYGTRTFLRNKDWKDTYTVWVTLATQNPNHAIANLNMAKILTERLELEKAIIYYNKYLSLASPSDPNLPAAKLILNRIYQVLTRPVF